MENPRALPYLAQTGMCRSTASYFQGLEFIANVNFKYRKSLRFWNAAFFDAVHGEKELPAIPRFVDSARYQLLFVCAFEGQKVFATTETYEKCRSQLRNTVWPPIVRITQIVTYTCVASSKKIQVRLGFWIPRRGFWIPAIGSGIFVSGAWIPDSNHKWDS